MCYRPLRLISNKLHFNPKVDKMYMSVPCGCCGECRTNLQNSFEARVYYEYLDTEKKGGYTFFQSFTYNQEFVPKKYGIYCFSPRDYRLFSHNFRHILERNGFSNSDVKIVWTCEYGGELFRPHYHALFFVKNPNITPQMLADFQEYAWCRFVHRFGTQFDRIPLGYLDTNNPDLNKRSRPEDRVVNGQGALSYVSKYVCKDFDFLRMVEGQIKNQKGVTEYTGPALEKLTKEDKKEMFPFHRQSQGLGISMVDVLTPEELFDGKCSIPDKLKSTKVVSLPQYIDRKVFYDYNPDDKTFHLNEKGLYMKEYRTAHNLDYVTSQLTQIFGNVKAFWSAKFAKKYSYIESPSDFKIEVMNLMHGRNFRQLANYIITYKDVSDYFANTPISDSLGEMLRLSSRIENDSTLSLRDRLDTRVGKRYIDYLCSRSYSNRPEFKNFEEVIMLFNDLNMFYCQGQQALYYKRQIEKSRQKKLYHSLYR